jgi:hypothetical protein
VEITHAKKLSSPAKPSTIPNFNPTGNLPRENSWHVHPRPPAILNIEVENLPATAGRLRCFCTTQYQV